MNEKNFSVEDVAKLAGCSFSQVYRWVRREAKPTLIYRKAIERTIKKMNKMSPIVTIEMAKEDRGIYRKLRKHLSLEENQRLFEISDYTEYQKHLRTLAKKYLS